MCFPACVLEARFGSSVLLLITVTQALLLLNFSLSENPVDSTFRMFRIWSFLFTLVQGMLLPYFVSYVCLSGCVDGCVCKYVIEEARG